MASCSYCDSFMLLGGKTDQTGHYCSVRCQQAGNLLALSYHVPQAQIERRVSEIHQGNCPRCGGRGPVDAHNAHEVWSALLLTSWSSRPALSCKSCGVKRQIGAAVFSGVLGWWGFPWGIVMTPVQVIRNVVEMVGGPKPGQPSALLERIARLQAGADFVQQSQRQPKPPALPASINPAAAAQASAVGGR